MQSCPGSHLYISASRYLSMVTPALRYMCRQVPRMSSENCISSLAPVHTRH